MRSWSLLVMTLMASLWIGGAQGAGWYPMAEQPQPLKTNAALMGDGFSIVPLAKHLEASASDVVVLYYFSATCGHCIQAGPTVAQLERDLKARGISVFGIASSRNNSMQVTQYKTQFGITFPIYRDSSAAFGRDNNIRQTPTVVVTRKNGQYRLFPGLTPGSEQLVLASAVQMSGGDALSLLKTDAYNGPRVCATCHVEEYRSWSLTHHSAALYSLKGEENIKNPECIGCHVTGWGKATGYTSLTETPDLVHVGCEQCHGIAGGHGKPRPPKQADATARWAATCQGCHDKKHSIGFTVEKGLPIISHAHNRDIPAPQFHEQRRKLERGLVERPLIAFPEGKIMGSESCQGCHAAEHAQWQVTSHAQAIASLKTKGEDQNPECLTCHAILTDADKRSDVTAWSPGVGCESCHGPGEQHVAAGGGTENIVGLTESCPVCVIEAMCTNCHTLEQDPDFSLDTHLPKAGHKSKAKAAE